jgi:8-oxo-dGTP pyrophosphatase MutT (NUDIX family)
MRRRRRTNPRKIEVDLEDADRGPTHLPAVVVEVAIAGHPPLRQAAAHIHRIPTHPIPHTVADLLGRRVAANPQDRRVVVDRRRNAVNRTESDRSALTVDLRTLVEEAGKKERQKSVRSVILLAQKARVLKIGRRRTRSLDPVKGLMMQGIGPKILPVADLSNEWNAKLHHSVHGLQIATDVLAREVLQETGALARKVTVGAILGRYPDLAVRVPFQGPTLEIGLVKLVSSNCMTH